MHNIQQKIRKSTVVRQIITLHVDMLLRHIVVITSGVTLKQKVRQVAKQFLWFFVLVPEKRQIFSHLGLCCLHSAQKLLSLSGERIKK